MCRNITPLFNFDPPVSESEIRSAALQYVRKVSGYTAPSKTNEESFNRAVAEITASTRTLLESLVTSAEPKNREIEAQRARARSIKRFGSTENKKEMSTE